LRVVVPLLEAPVADLPNWTIPRLRAEIEAQASVRINRSQLSKALRKKEVPLAAAATHPERAPDRRRGRAHPPAPAIAQAASSKQQAGDIVLLYGDESEALAHPFLARAWAKAGADLRPGPGTGKESRAAGFVRSRDPRTRRPHQPDQAQQRFRRLLNSAMTRTRHSVRPVREGGVMSGTAKSYDDYRQSDPAAG